MNLSRFLIGLVFIAALCALGLVLGTLIATTFFLPENAMGFDALATAMGGWMIGVGTALVLGIYLYRTLTTRALLIGLAIALLAIALIAVVTRMQQAEEVEQDRGAVLILENRFQDIPSPDRADA